MIFEHRVYTTRPFRLRPQLELFEKEGLPPISRHFGKPVLIGVQETGDVNAYIHIYKFDSFEERMERQAAMRADPDMQSYLQKLRESDNLVGQECRFLIAPPFFDPDA